MSLSSEGFDEDPDFGEGLDSIVDQYVEDEGLEGVVIEENRRFGVYLGRKNDSVRVGLSEEAVSTDRITPAEQNFVLAHELGHDKLESNHGNTEYSKEHGLMARLEEGATSLPHITLSETVAELSALEMTDMEDVPEFLNRSPFREEHEGSFSDYDRLSEKQRVARQLRPQLEDLKQASLDEPHEILDAYDESSLSEGYQSNLNFSHSLKSDLDKFDSHVMDEVGPAKVHYNHGEDRQFLFWTDFLQQLQRVKTEGIDQTNFLTHYWADKATSSVPGPREEPQFEVIDSYIPVDSEEFADKTLELHTDEDIRDSFTDVYRVIDSNSDDIFRDLEEFVFQKATGEMEEFVDRYGFEQDLNDESYPEIISDLENGSYDVGGVDYPHTVGCTMGKVLYDNDVEADDVVSDMGTYRDIAVRAIELAAEKGIEMDKGVSNPTHEDYIREVDRMVNAAT
ncbi:hypothetical protein [Candidatus Nanohalovita haloferacivicina]|uniref:hypothetical protein n=1 Tax=Candidatus Nanohalovita haloferacivicina TaxID=2978046 RepID=UPI00325FBEA7|nr:hypothetical protein HBNXNv_0498 [Candidatus Nanohalobia archaeon BNXNv]